MRQWYESLFENYAKQYGKEYFVQGTGGRVFTKGVMGV
jgi:hypothetical protein